MPSMSIEGSALPTLGDRAGARVDGGSLSPPGARKYIRTASVWLRKTMAPGGVKGLVMAVIFVIGTDAFLLLMRYLHEMPPVALSSLILVFVVAIRWGMAAAVVSTLGFAATFTYFLYSPFYTTSYDPVLLAVPFLTVSVVLGYLAARIRRETARAIQRENEVRDLYRFSQRVSAAHSPAGIFEAMQQHLETLVGRKILLFDSLGTLEEKSERLGDVEIPQAVTDAVSRMLVATDCTKDVVVDDHSDSEWLVHPVSANTAEFGVIAVDLGHSVKAQDELRARIVALIDDTGRSLERLGLARTIADARTRAETEHFREALLGSVSHELRTPLSSILGASTVLSLAPEVTGNADLKRLAALIHQESVRLNIEIENILDASRISGHALQPKLELAEPADFINAALQRCRNRLTGRAVEVVLPDELVLLRIDSVLMERALGQILDNAAKYSPAETPINVSGHLQQGQFVISVIDQGSGLDADDRTLLGQKFFRGNQHSQVTSGLGLGFWIASAFVAANNGTIEAASEGVNRGMMVTVRLPLPKKANDRPADAQAAEGKIGLMH
jgi:two-component system, OmpR family, sensor histidine kinase KdpD